MHYSILKPLTATTIALLTSFIPLDTLSIQPPSALAQTDPTALLAEADRLLNLGGEQYAVDQFPEAIESWQQALEIYQSASVRATFPQEGLLGEGLALVSLGTVYHELEQHPEAINFYEQSLTIFREIGDWQRERITLSSLGRAYQELEQYQEAINLYRQSLAIARERGDQQGEGIVLNYLGDVYIELGQYQEAIEFYKQSAIVLQESGNQVIWSGVLNNLGVALKQLGDSYLLQGQYQAAIEVYEQSLAIARERGDQQDEGVALGSLGNVYNSLGRYQEAIDLFKESFNIFREIGDWENAGTTSGNIGLSYLSLGQFQEAIDLHEQVLVPFFREIGDLRGEGAALNNLGLAYFRLGKYQEAIEFFEQHLTIAREIGDPRGESTALNNLGTAYDWLEQYQEAISFHEQALQIAREIGDREGEGLGLNNLGSAYYNLGEFSSSTDALLDAIEVFESLRTADLPDADNISFFDTYLRSYLSLQRSLIAQNNIEQALVFAERGRARAVADLLTNRITTTNPDAPLLGSIDLLDLADIQRVAREQNATLVQYSIFSFSDIDSPSLYIWVVQPTGDVKFQAIPLDEPAQEQFAGAVDVALEGKVLFRGSDTELTGLVSDVRPGNRSATRDVVAEPIDGALVDTRLQELYQLLIEPIQEYLPANETDRIVFIPQGGLFLVPFAALQDEEGNYLIEKHTISIAPSIQVLDLTRQQRQQANSSASSQDVLIVGDPEMPSIWNVETGTREQLNELPGAKAEAEAIADLFETEAILGSAATETSIADLMPNARIIHLATHGLLEYGIPQDSGVLDVPGAIALAPSESDDGLLTSAELLEMNLQAELVVLSACDTGRGRITGDGVIGLSRSLFSAGVPSVVVSLWSVPDTPTADLMVEFYRQLKTTPDKAQALREAMLITMQDHPNPIDWAGFTLIGEAR